MIAIIVMLLSCSALLADSPEDDYLAARDRDLALFAKLEDAKDAAARDAQYDQAIGDLERKLKALVGTVAVPGFPAIGKLNLDSLYPHDEGFGMLDGLVFGESESAKSVVVTTVGLFNTWLLANGKRMRNDSELPPDVAAALKSEAFYTMAVSTDSAVVHYAELPVVAPPGATFAHAMLSARTQFESPKAPDQIFVALEYGGRVFIVNEKLATPILPIAACDASKASNQKRADALDERARAKSGPERQGLSDQADRLHNEGEAAFRACVGSKLKSSPAFSSATRQATAIITALTH